LQGRENTRKIGANAQVAPIIEGGDGQIDYGLLIMDY
jgi:hypothetical protein